MTKKLLLATNNQAKVREYRNLFQDLSYELVTPADMNIDTSVNEDGASFEENAMLKATTFAAESRLLSLADDSGLEVDALDGEPGVISARYAGEGATDMERINYLLARLKDVPWEKRSARFRCVIAIVSPGTKTELCSGECTGFVTFTPRGEHGFGYDPIFYLPERDKTMAELTMKVKNRISHRGQAAKKAYQVLRRLCAE
ncbi:XTP/dITP diphosphatase [Chloroflexota bacterium]